MLNYIWFVMIVIGFFVGALNGRLDQVSQAAMGSSKTAVELCIGLLGILCLWSGLMGIAEKSGLVTKIAKISAPIIKVLFPDLSRKGPAVGAMVMNMAANFFGLGNAATPLGLKAMNELQKNNKDKHTASNSMIMFLVLNTTAIQLVPATVIALRSAAGSTTPADIMIPVWIASLCATVAGVAAVKIMTCLDRKGKGR